jgi:uncharacterized protein YndB with AHSA1/START domain
MMPAPLTVTMPTDTDVVVVRTFDAPRDVVWRAHTEPRLVKKWLLGPPGWTMPTCEIDLRVGGRYRYGWKHPEQQGFEMTGTFNEIKAPERIVHSEEFKGMEAKITTLFAEKAGKTTMTMTMHFPSKAARDGAVKTGMTDGMEQSYRNLDAMVATKAVA